MNISFHQTLPNGQRVRLECSAFTGKEYLYIDNQLVHEKLNWRLKGSHKTRVEDKELAVLVEQTSLTTGDLIVEFIYDGESLSQQCYTMLDKLGPAKVENLDRAQQEWLKSIDQRNFMDVMTTVPFLLLILTFGLFGDVHTYVAWVGFSVALLAGLWLFIRGFVRSFNLRPKSEATAQINQL